MKLHKKFIGLVIVCHGVNTIKLSQVKLLFWALKTVATLLFCFFFTLFNEFITGSVRQVIGTQQVWDVTYCNQAITTFNV